MELDFSTLDTSDAIAIAAAIFSAGALLIAFLSWRTNKQANRISAKGLDLAKSFAKADEHADLSKKIAEIELEVDTKLSNLRLESSKSLNKLVNRLPPHPYQEHYDGYGYGNYYEVFFAKIGSEIKRVSLIGRFDENSFKWKLERFAEISAKYSDERLAQKLFSGIYGVQDLRKIDLSRWMLFYYAVFDVERELVAINLMPKIKSILKTVTHDDLIDQLLFKQIHPFLISNYNTLLTDIDVAIESLESLLLFNYDLQIFELDEKIRMRCLSDISRLKMIRATLKTLEFYVTLDRENTIGKLIMVGIIFQILSSKFRDIASLEKNSNLMHQV